MNDLLWTVLSQIQQQFVTEMRIEKLISQNETPQYPFGLIIYTEI